MIVNTIIITLILYFIAGIGVTAIKRKQIYNFAKEAVPLIIKNLSADDLYRLKLANLSIEEATVWGTYFYCILRWPSVVNSDMNGLLKKLK